MDKTYIDSPSSNTVEKQIATLLAGTEMVPVGSREMGLDDIGQFSSYVERWSTGGDSCTMNWGLYEIPNSTKMSITIVANLPIYQSSLKAL